MPNLNHGSGPLVKPRGWTPPGVSAGDQINVLIDAALQARRAKEPERKYIGASELGDPCLRRLYYSNTGAPRKPFDGRKLRIFRMGHQFEDMMADWLQAAGFHLVAKNRAGRQFEFVTGNGRIKGHSDGVLVAGPNIVTLPYPALWENKALGAKYWSQLVKKGLQLYEPKYWAQVHLYMGYFELEICLFTSLNKNTGEVYHEIIRYQAAEAQRYSDVGVSLIRAIDSGRIPNRIAARPDYYTCRMCDFAETICWKGEL